MESDRQFVDGRRLSPPLDSGSAVTPESKGESRRSPKAGQTLTIEDVQIARRGAREVLVPTAVFNHAAVPDADRSGSRSTILLVSRSTRMVPYLWPLLQAQSSRPRTRRACQADAAKVSRITCRRTVVPHSEMPSLYGMRFRCHLDRPSPFGGHTGLDLEPILR
jgi:hypothetical protein